MPGDVVPEGRMGLGEAREVGRAGDGAHYGFFETAANAFVCLRNLASRVVEGGEGCWSTRVLENQHYGQHVIPADYQWMPCHGFSRA